MARAVPQEEEEMQNSAARMAFCRYVRPRSLPKMPADSDRTASKWPVERLQAFLRDEKENSEGLSDYRGGLWRSARSCWTCKSIAHTLTPKNSQQELNWFLSASDDLSQPTLLRSLLKDIREVRQAKIRMGLQSEDVLQNDYLQVMPFSSLCPAALRRHLTRYGIGDQSHSLGTV